MGELRGAGAPTPYNSNPIFDEIWIISVNLHEKNNEIGQNSLGGHVRELWGLIAPLKIQIHPIFVKFGPYT